MQLAGGLGEGSAKSSHPLLAVVFDGLIPLLACGIFNGEVPDMFRPLAANPGPYLFGKATDYVIIHVLALVRDFFLAPAVDAAEVCIEQ